MKPVLLLALLAQIGAPAAGAQQNAAAAATTVAGTASRDSAPQPSAAPGVAAPNAGARQAPAPARATPKSFTARTDPATVRLGQPFTIEVAITDAPDVRYTLPQGLQLGTLDVRGVHLERAQQGDDLVTTARIEVAIFDALGAAQLPDVAFTATGPAGVAQLAVPGPPITVESTADGEQLDDIGAPQPLVSFSPLPLWIALGVALSAAALVFAVRHFRRRPRVVHEAPAPVGTPEERALAALDALEARGLEGDGRAFYFSLSDVVRGFLEEVGARNAREMTTRELVDSLVAREVPGLSLAQLGAWLERGDLHRFARVPAVPDHARTDLERAREMVRGVAAALRPAPQAEEAA